MNEPFSGEPAPRAEDPVRPRPADPDREPPAARMVVPSDPSKRVRIILGGGRA